MLKEYILLSLFIGFLSPIMASVYVNYGLSSLHGKTRISSFSATAKPKEEWRLALEDGRRYGMHVRSLGENVHRELGYLQATYKLSSCSQLGARLPEIGFDRLSFSVSAKKVV